MSDNKLTVQKRIKRVQDAATRIAKRNNDLINGTYDPKKDQLDVNVLPAATTIEKMVWLNIETGEFSNSWDDKEYDGTDAGSTCSREQLIKDAGKGPWKLIKYECLNDEDFDFYNAMRLR